MSAVAEDLYHRYRFSVEEDLRMGEAGILGEEDRVELIDGEIVDKPPIALPRFGAINRVASLLARRLGARIVLSIQKPIRIGGFSLPEPDIALLRPRDDLYASAYPEPNDILLPEEVAESSARCDREWKQKLPLYAAAGITEAWLVDIPARPLLIHREPSANGCRSIGEPRDLGAVAPATLLGCHIDLSGLFR